MVTFLFILGLIIVIICLVLIFILSKNDKLTMIVYKTGMCEVDIDERLKNKEDLTIRSINIINRQIKLDIKIFEDVKNLKAIKLNNYEKDKLLSDAFIQITKIYEDNGLIKDIEKIDIELISLRTLYNKYASEFNNLYNKFPYKLICYFKKLKLKTLYEGAELKGDMLKELNLIV